MSLVGTTIRHYRVVEPLGAGGMGQVWVARDERLERLVALKAIRPERRMRPEARRRLLEEARVLSQLEHPSICRVYDYLEEGDQHYLVLELIRGRTLRGVLNDGQASRRARVRWASEIADGLVAAHGAGVVHHDLKPDNVMIDESGRARILDFGIAARGKPLASTHSGRARPDDDGRTLDPDATVDADVTATVVSRRGSVSGTPSYMSPEQARGEPTGPASDMFSFGLLLHEMFTGARAYEHVETRELVAAITRGRTPRARTHDRDLTRLIERLKDPVPSRRPTAVEATEVLARVRGRRARRIRRGVAAAIVLVAIGGGIKYTLDVSRERRAAEFRRGQAEELIEFMLGDLRDRLEPVGRLDALSAVGDKALDYFASLDETQLTPADRERYGRALSQIGAVKTAGGDLDGAMEAYTESTRVFRALLAEDPADASRAIALGGALFGVGAVHWERDELDEAAAAFDEYLELAIAVHEREPDDPGYRLELGYALTNVAAVHEALGRSDEAIAELDRAIAIKRAIVEDDPDNTDAVQSLANTLAWLADTEEARGNLRHALALHEENLALRRRALDERDATSRRNVSLALAQTGRLRSRLGEGDAAITAYREDLSISRDLVRLDPANAEWKRGLAVTMDNLGSVAAGTMSLEEREALVRRARDMLAELVSVEPDNATWRLDLLSARRSLAALVAEAGRPDEARELLAGHLSASLEDADEPAREELCLGTIAYVRLSGLSGSSTPRLIERALTVSDGLSSVEALGCRAQALDLAKRDAEARPILTRLASLGYAPPQFRGIYERYGIDVAGR